MEYRKVALRTGKELQPGEFSGTGLYAVCKRSGWSLRVTFFQELAELWRDDTRIIKECYLDA